MTNTTKDKKHELPRILKHKKGVQGAVPPAGVRWDWDRKNISQIKTEAQSKIDAMHLISGNRATTTNKARLFYRHHLLTLHIGVICQAIFNCRSNSDIEG